MPPQTSTYIPLSQRKGRIPAMYSGGSGTIDDIMKGLSHVESGGKYDALGQISPTTGDRAYGKYQAMGQYIPGWSKQYLGRELTPEQYLADPKAQEDMMRARATELYEKYGNADDVASVHFTGRPVAEAGLDVTDYTGTSNASYLQKFRKGMGQVVQKYIPLAQRTIEGIPQATADLFGGAIQKTGEGLGMIDRAMGLPAYIALNKRVSPSFGQQVDDVFGLPGRIATNNNPNVPTGFSQQVEGAVAQGTGNEMLGMGAGLIASFAEPAGLPGKASKIAKDADKAFEGFTDLSTKLLEKLNGRSTVSRQFIEDLTNSPDLKQAEKDTFRRLLAEESDTVNVPTFANKVKSELLPLKRDSTGVDNMRYQNDPNKDAPRYENISLPQELRGPVANYSEHVYQSPISTSAGNVHFGYKQPNYFAHSRIEDLPDNTTRRIIEAQSDLFQKGRLEQEKLRVGRNADGTWGVMGLKSNDRGQSFSEKLANFDTEEEAVAWIAKNDPTGKLEPYRNTWHERVIREEIKQAAIDGKTKLQFPTGETAMKIEGIGQGANSRWYTTRQIGADRYDRTAGTLEASALKVGETVSQGGNDLWIITDVLGDGKFKAVPKEKLDGGMTRGSQFNFSEKLGENEQAVWDRIKFNYAEEFDISGKVDTENPIYKFYEKTVAKYLTNKYGGKVITDPQGVKWVEIDVKPEHKKLPVEAFGLLAPIAAGLGYQQTQNEDENVR